MTGKTDDIGASFNRLISTFMYKYRGVLIERKDGGYMWGRVHYPTIEELDKAIDKTYSTLERSINKIKSPK